MLLLCLEDLSATTINYIIYFLVDFFNLSRAHLEYSYALLEPTCFSLLNSKLLVFVFLVQIENMDALFEAQFSPLADSGRALSKCGKCLRYMKYISTQPSRMYCGTCEEVYYLPQKGTIKVVWVFKYKMPHLFPCIERRPFF